MSVLALIRSVVIKNCEPNIAFVEHIHGQWVPIGNQDPLPDVELLFVYDKRVLDVLLDHPMPAFAFFDVLEDFSVLAEHGDSSASALVAWFYDP